MTVRRLRWAAWPVIAVLAAAVPAAGTAGAEPPPGATVTVNARAGLATVPDTALGVNHAIWDSQLGTDRRGRPARRAGVRMMRYPGGSYADIYHWKDNTAPGGYVAPGTDFDTFMGGVRRAGAQPMIIANYGTGTPQEAADWVRYANVTKGYGVRYWEIGNENYGNGHYGANWEADNHADKSPAAYAAGVVAYAEAMKAVDPTIKIGAVLTTPANWPDGIVGAGDTAHLEPDGAVDRRPAHRLRRCCTGIPAASTAAEALTKTEQVDDMIYLAREQITQYAGAGLEPDRHQPDRDEHGGRHEHPAGRAVRGRRLQRRCWRTASSPSTGGTCTTASTARVHCGRLARLRRLRPALQRRPASATAAASPR